MTKTTKADAFLQAASVSSTPVPAVVEPPANDLMPAKPKAPSRTGLKHIGGYLDRNDVEKFAILRARLGLDNSQLIKLAIEELYAKHQEKRAFDDAQVSGLAKEALQGRFRSCPES